MKLTENDIPEFVRELRDIVSKISGVEGYTEVISLSYVVKCADETSKQNVESISQFLAKSALAHGIELDIIPATQADLDEAAELINKQSSFQT